MVNTSVDKKKQTSKKPDKKGWLKIAEILRQIPSSETDGVYLKNLVDDPKELSQIELLLNLFGAVDYVDGAVKAKSILAQNFLFSLAEYLENGNSLTSNWHIHRDPVKTTEQNFLDKGINLLLAMENRRETTTDQTKPLDVVEIILFVLKANVKGYHEPQYLMEYNTKTHRYQFLGGYMSGDSPSDKRNYMRLANKDLAQNEFDIDKDLKISEFTEEVTSYSISTKWGVYTQYKVHLCHVTINKKNLKINGKERWFTIQEIVDGVTSDGIGLQTPFQEVQQKEKLRNEFDLLPLSMEAVQKEIPLDVLSKAVGNRKKTDSRLKEYITKEESKWLEYKSSARWDYIQKKVNKDLEKNIIKTISAFLNTNGGTLIIGCDDNKRILGIEPDLETISKPNEDGYMQYLIGQINYLLGVEYCSFVDISFDEYKNKKICFIDVTRSPKPVFLKEKEDREFYVRAANSTRQLNPEETYKYIQLNW
jgi:hypothetical protein